MKPRTAKRQSKAASPEPEQDRYYVAMVESANIAFFTTGLDGTINIWNPGAARLFGYPAGEAVGRNASMLVPPERRDEIANIQHTIATGGRLDNFVTARVGKNGQRIDVALTISPVMTSSGSPIGLSVIARDMTVQKITEDMFRLAFEACPAGMLMFDRAGLIVLANAETERLFGYGRGELINHPVDVLVPLRLRAEQAWGRSASAPGLGGRRETRRDLIGLRKDGSEFPIEVSLNPLHVRGSVLVLGVVVDMSERQRSERLKDEFVATVSHELRTPLTSIAGSLGLLVGNAAGKVPDSVTRMLTIAHTNCQRLVRLVNDIVDVEKIQSGKVVFVSKKIKARPLVEQAIAGMRGFADSCGVRLKLDPGSATACVRADPDRLLQAVTNLLSNAIKFSSPDTQVVVAIELHDQTVRILIRDHGPGIPEDFKSRIFEKFARVDTADDRREGGVGLGLSIVKQIMSRLDGDVGFDAAAGGGTVFHVDLPLWEPAAGMATEAATGG